MWSVNDASSSASVRSLRHTIICAVLPLHQALASTIKARWICEQAHQQLKEELGLDHFEGRSWQGLHRHAPMTMIAYTFLQHRRLATAKRGKKESPDHRHSQACPRCVIPSSRIWSLHGDGDARIAANGSARHDDTPRSAKRSIGSAIQIVFC
jgi:hypothetical protein